MRNISRPAAAVAAIALSGLCVLLVPNAAVAEAGSANSTKAGIEYAERMAAASEDRSKAQIEYDERMAAEEAAGTNSRSDRGEGVSVPLPADSSAAAWQLALSAALGAALTGGVVLATRQVNHHRHAIAA